MKAISRMNGFFFFLFAALYSTPLFAQEALHPYNKFLISSGQIPDVNYYYPHIPRMTAQRALALYQTGKALMIKIGTDGEQVIGGFALKENEAWQLDPHRLPLGEKRVLLLYCA